MYDMSQTNTKPDRIELRESENEYVPKPANRYFRWNLLLTVIIILCFSVPFWLPWVPVVNQYTMDVMLAILLMAHLPWLFISYNSFQTVRALRAARGQPTESKLKIELMPASIKKLYSRKISHGGSMNGSIKVEPLASIENGDSSKRRSADELTMVKKDMMKLSRTVSTPPAFGTVPKLPPLQEDGTSVPAPTYVGVQHLIGIVMYKEPLGLMEHTLNSLTAQPNAVESLSVVVGMEEGSPEKDDKQKMLYEKYRSKFRRFLVSIHPKGLPGEIPGKCSNFGYAMKSLIEMVKSDSTFGLVQSNTLVTTADCDSLFPVGYFQLLEKDFLENIPLVTRNRYVWQSPLFYQIGLDKSPFFVRITGLYRSVLMMGALIPYSINTMSIFSLTLNLYENGGGTHPGYQMDDIIALIRWMLHVGQPCRIRRIDLPTLSGPTSGATYIEELYEWARQVRRWAIGAGEVFHYFMVKANRLPLTVSIMFAFKFMGYYVFLLGILPLFTLIAPPISEGMMTLNPDITTTSWLIPVVWQYHLTLVIIGLCHWLWAIVVFGLNYGVDDVLSEKHRNKVGFFTNVLHILLSVPTLLALSVIQILSLIELSFRGKEVCTHKPSRKSALAKMQGSIKSFKTSIKRRMSYQQGPASTTGMERIA